MTTGYISRNQVTINIEREIVIVEVELDEPSLFFEDEEDKIETLPEPVELAVIIEEVKPIVSTEAA